MTRRQVSLLAAIASLSIAAGALHYADGPAVARFAAAGAALAGLAWIVAFSTEAVGARFGPGVTGVMQSTLGNLPEFFVVLFALGAGEVTVAKTSLVGSLLANALLILGLAIVVGARASKDGVMRFHPRLPNDTATLLLLAVFIIVVLGLAVTSHDAAGRHAKGISIAGAISLLVVYAVWLTSYLRGDTVPGEHDERDERGAEPGVSLGLAIGLLAVAGVGAALVSDWFIKALDPAVASLGISKAFAGLVIVAIAGNAVENVTGIVFAAKGQSDLAISVIKNSVAQIAVFLFPALILASLFFATPLTFVLSPVYIAALGLTAIAVWQITGDGEAYAFEGVALVALYAIVATVAWYQ
ncbi:MAG: Ca2+:H+ antiporter [Solirubrobacterales bacterium]|nr:Ca2+:H+ antiporter [Solirubrobacterales bacterium]